MSEEMKCLIYWLFLMKKKKRAVDFLAFLAQAIINASVFSRFLLNLIFGQVLRLTVDLDPFIFFWGFKKRGFFR